MPIHDYEITWHPFAKPTQVTITRSAHVATYLREIQSDGGVIEGIRTVCDTGGVDGYCVCAAARYEMGHPL